MTQASISIVFAALMACGAAAAGAQPVPARADASPPIVESGQAAAEQLQALLDEDLAAVFRRYPLFATVRGVPGYNHLLPDLSPATRERERANERWMLSRLQAIDAGALHGQDRVSLQLLLDKMQSAVGAQRFVNSDALVLSTLGGIQNMMPRAAQIRDFHAVVIDNGPMPLAVLEKLMDEWIDRRAVSGREVKQSLRTQPCAAHHEALRLHPMCDGAQNLRLTDGYILVWRPLP